MTAKIFKTNIATANRLKDKDYEECVRKRGLNPEWIAVNCRSMEILDASARLGYTAKSAGIWLESVNGFGQFRPNKPWKNDSSEKKAPKYRTATGEKYDAMLPHHPHNPRYWDDLEALKALAWKIDGHPCLGITEGMFKALAACSHDIPCVALAGVEQGLTPASDDVQGKRYLVETLSRLADARFGWIIIFDADAATNLSVVQAQRKLAAQLAKFKVPVYIATGLWSVDQGKGMDDYIKKFGAEQFKREVMGKVIDLATWEKQFHYDDTKRDLPPKQAAQRIALDYRIQWKYDLAMQAWRRYNGKVWEQIPDKVFEKAIYHDLEAMPNASYSKYSYIENVAKFLGLELLERKWESFSRAEWIAFNDFVLEVSTKKRHKHSPGFMFTSNLDHDCPEVQLKEGENLLDALKSHAPTFYEWAMYSQNSDSTKVLKMLAFFNGVLTYKFSELQMFMMILGVPGSGKGTFARLLEKAVGKNNHTSAKLHRLGEDNVIANIIDKQLVVCPDEKKQASDNSGVLVLTGGDNIPYRQVYRPMASARFDGSLMVVANSNPFVGDTTGIERRWSLIQFDKPLLNRDSAVEKKMQSELGAIMALAIAMPDQQVRNLIRGVGEGLIPDFKRQQWLHRTENDSIALFMEEMLIPVSLDNYTMLGGKGNDPASLYGAYIKMCEENNTRSLYTKNNFRSHLQELCREVGWETKEHRGENGWRVYGVGIRGFGDDSNRVSDQMGGCRPCRPPVDPTVDLKPLPDKAAVDPVDLFLPKDLRESHRHHPMHDDHIKKEENPIKVYRSTASAQDKASGSTGSQQDSTGSRATDEVESPTQSAHDLGCESVATQESNIKSPTGSTGSIATHEVDLSYAQQIMANWDSQQALGKIILEIADTEKLRQETRDYSTEQLQHIKNAAKSVWKPGCNSYAEYCGEKVELWEFGSHKRDWKVRSLNGSIIKAARGNVSPWLGI